MAAKELTRCSPVGCTSNHQYLVYLLPGIQHAVSQPPCMQCLIGFTVLQLLPLSLMRPKMPIHPWPSTLWAHRAFHNPAINAFFHLVGWPCQLLVAWAACTRICYYCIPSVPSVHLAIRLKCNLVWAIQQTLLDRFTSGLFQCEIILSR